MKGEVEGFCGKEGEDLTTFILLWRKISYIIKPTELVNTDHLIMTYIYINTIINLNVSEYLKCIQIYIYCVQYKGFILDDKAKFTQQTVFWLHLVI